MNGRLPPPPHICIINLGLYRTGTTTLADALSKVQHGQKAFKVNRQFPSDLKSELLRGMLVSPEATVCDWWFHRRGKEGVQAHIERYNVLCDGWMALLVYLPHDELTGLVEHTANIAQTDKFHNHHSIKSDIRLHFVATARRVEDIVQSELHHWVRHDLERKVGLNAQERRDLPALLRKRAQEHAHRVESFIRYCDRTPVAQVTELPLIEIASWPRLLAPILELDEENVQYVFHAIHSNAHPALPIQGILLTLRIASPEARDGVTRLLGQIEEDDLCQYLLFLALDQDEITSSTATQFCQELKQRPRMKALHVLANPPTVDNGPFPICQVWHTMAEKAWKEGAAWVVLLGDDVSIEDGSFHYRAIYRAFLDQRDRFDLEWFGCPWFNDETFPGFPTFPVIGAAHHAIFGGLIPPHRISAFCNQDLDPYLQRLYLKFGASPPMDVRLRNQCGGTDACPARYERCGAAGWRDWVLQDVTTIKEHVKCKESHLMQLVDVVIPTYRLDLDYLERLCSLQVPSGMRTTFIVVVDNPQLLLQKFSPATTSQNVEVQLFEAARSLEAWLVQKSAHGQSNPNNIRVRCNRTNQGASASRNRGIDESAAEYVLFLDDDVRPEANVLDAYYHHLLSVEKDPSVFGLVGLVQFPRSPTLPLKHCAVLMSFLTFMFEIALNPSYSEPAWGVTANLLVKRTKLRFDTDYAKTGGGEDVDFCLRLLQQGGRNDTKRRFLPAPEAIVHHEYWPGSSRDLARHFFLWATGDSALFARFPRHCYRSWPNLVETVVVFAIPLAVMSFTGSGTHIAATCLHLCWYLSTLLAADIVVDMCNAQQFQHRRDILWYDRSWLFCVRAHVLANIFVAILEAGRMYGHGRRFQMIRNFAKRFDWHCGRLKQSKGNFRQTELRKFALFAALTVGWYLKITGSGPRV